MPARKLDVLLLYDVPYAPSNDRPWREFMHGAEWKDERDVIRALVKLGHRVTPFGVFDDVQPLVDRLTTKRPDVVFNMVEAFRSDRSQEPNLTALLELLGVPHTGARAEALRLCKDKGLTKKILSYHDLRVPRFEVSPKRRPRRALAKDFAFPALCKPLDLESSEGIAQTSLVKSEEDCLERIRFIHEKLDADAIVEEYIEGRELYVGVFGNERLTVLPPQELFFKHTPEHVPRFLTYKAKWDETYRKKYGIDSDGAKALAPELIEELNEMCKQIYRLCKLSGYARVDLRLSREEEPVFIEVNPNPSIKKTDDFAWAARRAGIAYEDLIGRIVGLALAG